MALIGTLAINMSVRTQSLVAGMKKASKSVSDFGSKATAGIKKFTSPIASAGRATAGVVDQFYVAPFMKAGKAIGEVGKEVGKSLAWAGKGLSGPMAAGGGIFASMATGAAKMGKVTAHGIGTVAAGAFRAMAGTIGVARNALGSLTKTLLSVPSLIAGGALGALFFSAARGAMDLFEQVNRARIIFGEYAKTVIDMGDKMAVAFGISRREFTAGAASFADIFRDAKYSEKDVASLSIHFNQLALDMASFYDIPIADALEKLHSGLAGNVKPLRDLGMSVYDETVKEYAHAHGIARVGEELTSQQKIQARAILIDEKAAKAKGDLANTANSAANQVRSLAGRFENLKESIGTTLVGLLLPAFNDVNVGLHAIQMSWDVSGLAADKATKDAIAGAGAQAKGIGFVQRAIMSAADAWQGFKIAAIDAGFQATHALAEMARGLKDWIGMLSYVSPALGVVADKMDGLIPKLESSAAAQMKSLRAARQMPPPSLAIADMFEKARADIGKTRAGLAAAPSLNPADLKPTLPPAKPAGEPRFASAAMVGSSEAANAVLRSRYGAGAGGKKPEEETAKNTRRLVQLFEKIGGAAAAGGLGQAQAQAFGGGALLAGNF